MVLSQFMNKDSEGFWCCLSCSHKSKNSRHVKHHIESKHVTGYQFACSYCEVVCSTRNALGVHIHRKHKQQY